MIDGIYNSKNIEEAYGTNPDLLIYAGLRAEKYLANSAPEKDYKLILQAEDNITRINPRKLVLMSLGVLQVLMNIHRLIPMDYMHMDIIDML